MALNLSISYQGGTSASNAMLSVTSYHNDASIQGNDVIVNIGATSTYSGAEIKVFLQPSISYSKDYKRYTVSISARVYRGTAFYGQHLKFRFSAAPKTSDTIDFSGNITNYKNWTSQASLSTSSSTFATVLKYYSPGDSAILRGRFILEFTTDNGASIRKTEINLPWVKIFCESNELTHTFKTNGYIGSSGNSQSTQESGEWGSACGKPYPYTRPPAWDLNRNIVVTFDPSPSEQSSLTSSVPVTDSLSESGWNPNPANIQYSNNTFTYTYSRGYSTSPVLIPAWNTMDGKPTRTGYIFNYWKYGGSDIGSEPYSQTNYNFGNNGVNSYTATAVWTVTKKDFIVHPKVKYNNELINIPGGSDLVFTLDYDKSKSISDMEFIDYTNKGFKLDRSGIYPITDTIGNPENKITSLSGDMSQTEYYVLYELITDTVTLNLNGGNVNGNTSNITISYNRFSDGISLRDDRYVPTKSNTTFIGWVYDNQYISEIIPTEQTQWPMNRTFVADYINIGMFILLKDRLGRPHWYPVINKWVFKGGAWRGEYSIVGTTVVHTSTSAWVLKDGTWHLEYGKTNLPLG